jgi:nucleoside-diphosphate-sugar epimerase
LNVHDVSAALFKAFQSHLNGVINIADNKNIRVVDIANKCNYVFKNLDLKYIIKKKQISRPYLVEIKKLNLLNFKKFYTLEKGLKKFL